MGQSAEHLDLRDRAARLLGHADRTLLDDLALAPGRTVVVEKGGHLLRLPQQTRAS